MIEICIDKQHFSAKPTTIDTAIISSRIAEHSVVVTFEEFVHALRNGQTWTPGTFKNGIRKSSKWRQQQVFAADIDSNNLLYGEIIDLVKTFDLPAAVIHESFSSSAECHKWRIIFISDKSVIDPVDALAILRKIKLHFDSDAAIVDLARLLYGTTSNKIHFAEENYFNYHALDLSDFHKAPDTIANVAISRLPEKSKINKKSKFILAKVQRLLRLVPESRYQAVWHSARLMTQSKLFSEKAIRYEITGVAAISSKFDLDSWDKNIDDVITSAISWGMAHTWEED